MRSAPASSAPRRRGRVVVALVIALPVALVGAGPALAAEAELWREVLERAVEATRTIPYSGETLLVELDDDRPRMLKGQVRSSGEGALELGEALHLRLDTAVPARSQSAHGRSTLEMLARLSGKYEVTVVGTDELMDRPCTILEVRRRVDDVLRERLWIDEESGLLVRRETFVTSDEPVRLATYLSLDLTPEPGPSIGQEEVLAEASDDDVEAAEQPVVDTSELLDATGARPVDERGLAALRQSGWAVPPSLPGGFAALGAYTVQAEGSQPLQLVYGDGLYVVSVFQQSGTPDWSSLPPGAQLVEGADHPLYEWPGAVPHRLLWEAGGRTFSLVGDAPPAELLNLAAALPQPEPPGVLERLGRGLGRLWSWATAFAR